MKYKTSELEGALLDAGVAKFLSLEGCVRDWDGLGAITFQLKTGAPFRPSANWCDGGPIIGRWNIELHKIDRNGKLLGYVLARAPGGPFVQGLDDLTAAMRCMVASVYGEEIELP